MYQKPWWWSCRFYDIHLGGREVPSSIPAIGVEGVFVSLLVIALHTSDEPRVRVLVWLFSLWCSWITHVWGWRWDHGCKTGNLNILFVFFFVLFQGHLPNLLGVVRPQGQADDPTSSALSLTFSVQIRISVMEYLSCGSTHWGFCCGGHCKWSPSKRHLLLSTPPQCNTYPSGQQKKSSLPGHWPAYIGQELVSTLLFIRNDKKKKKKKMVFIVTLTLLL